MRTGPATGPAPDNLPIQPSPLHTHRPLHLMRQPSINPPSFYDDVAPPPLLTPPPNYDDLTPRIEVRDGYFDVDGSGSNTDEDEVQTPPEEGQEEEPEEGDEEEEEEEDIVDMVGLEDLSLGLRVGSPIGRRSLDFGIWAR
jgi:hypothetical protein